MAVREMLSPSARVTSRGLEGVTEEPGRGGRGRERRAEPPQGPGTRGCWLL